MKYYKIRIDLNNTTKEAVVKLLTKYTTRFILGWEDLLTDNPHCHAFAHSLTKVSTLRSNFRKLTGGGNGNYSCPEMLDEYPIEYIAYILKQNDNFYHLFPQEIVDKAKVYDLQVKKEIKEKKKSKQTILDQIIAEYKYNENPPSDTLQVVTDVISFYQTHGKLVREFAMVSQVQTLLLRYIEDYKYTLATNIFKAIDKTRL